ncbi:hypothetical protein ACYCAX_11615 [Pseudomonas sp. MT3]
MTNLPRFLRLNGRPVTLLLAGLAGAILIDPIASAPYEQISLPFKRALYFGALSMTAIGALWCSWNAWLEYRWSRGELNGGCDDCGGHVRHLSGRYGAYSKCLMCGSKRNGWH